jgi:hypothetical protein
MIIVTKKLTGGGSEGSGAYTQLEKLNMELEMAFKAAQVSNYKELSYDVNGNLETITIYTNTGKGTTLFQKTLLYDTITQSLTAAELERISDGIVLRKVLEYDVNGNLADITQTKV